MFSYRHGFHAGNHADVLKHITLVHILRYLAQKDTALSVVDTHAGAGLYRLDSAYAEKSGEAAAGIGLLWDAPIKAQAIVDYLDQIRGLNPQGRLVSYPGSPVIEWQLLREQDRLHLFELHPTDQEQLRGTVRQLDAGTHVEVRVADGFTGLKSLLPPPSRRGLVLMDPSYEIKSDYERVHSAVADALKRFATGTYVIWYPTVALLGAHELPDRLRRLAVAAGRPWLNATLTVRAASVEHRGLVESGMFVINPPYTLADALREALPELTALLKQGKGAGWTVTTDADRVSSLHAMGRPAVRAASPKSLAAAKAGPTGARRPARAQKVAGASVAEKTTMRDPRDIGRK